MDNIRSCYQQMCREMPGGWAAMAAAMNMSKDALENRIYERKGQTISVHEAMQLQAFHGNTLFAQAIAKESGGVFVPLPEISQLTHDEIRDRFMELVQEVGQLAQAWRNATQDDEIDAKERYQLEQIQQAICSKTIQINQLTFRIFCKH